MSDTTGVEGVAEAAAAQETTDAAVTPEVSGAEVVRGNPAWGEILDKTPSALHPMMTPVFEKWDKNFQEVQTKYAPYKTYVDQGVAPETIDQSLQIMRLLNENPRAIFDQMVETFKDEWGLNQQQAEQAAAQQVQGQPEQTPPSLDLGQENVYDITKDPRFVELKQQQDVLANYLTTQIQQQEAAAQEEAANKALDTEIAKVKQEKGNFNERIVFSLVASNPGMSIADAVDIWKADLSANARPAPGANYPPVMSPGGGSPSQAVDVTALNNKDTIGLVKSWIANSNKE